VGREDVVAPDVETAAVPTASAAVEPLETGAVSPGVGAREDGREEFGVV